jgi:hypothetical protein
MKNSMQNEADAKSRIALAIVGSNLTAIAAELAAETSQWKEVLAITRRDCLTSLPVVMDGGPWAEKLRNAGIYRLRRLITAFEDHITAMVDQKPFDCLIHHSTDRFSQLLASHPLCRRFYYIEEGFTALIGDKFGRPKKRRLRKALWRLESSLFYGQRVDRSRSFFDVNASNYGGCYALSPCSFKGFPGRVQLPFQDVSMGIEAPADTIVFLDSQYLIGNCTMDAYAQALTECLSSLPGRPFSLALKFHPNERDLSRKASVLNAVASIPAVSSVVELPATFIGERISQDPGTRIVVGTSAIGFYLGERGFPTFTFAPRLASTSPKFAAVMNGIPPDFLRVCQPG